MIKITYLRNCLLKCKDWEGNWFNVESVIRRQSALPKFIQWFLSNLMVLHFCSCKSLYYLIIFFKLPVDDFKYLKKEMFADSSSWLRWFLDSWLKIWFIGNRLRSEFSWEWPWNVNLNIDPDKMVRRDLEVLTDFFQQLV